MVLHVFGVIWSGFSMVLSDFSMVLRGFQCFTVVLMGFWSDFEWF